MLAAIHEHTVRLPLHGTVIDVGCYGWEFACGVLDRGADEVIAVDPRIDSFPPRGGIRPLRAAVANSCRFDWFLEKSDPSGSCLNAYDWDCKTTNLRSVECVSLTELVQAASHDISVLKLDCEGAESEILASITEPVFEQITIEFHCHTVGERRPLGHLLQWYDVVQDEFYERRGRFNYWDTLLVRKC